MKKTLATLAASVALAITANAQVLYSTTFDAPTYTNGNLVGQDGWAAHSGAGAVPVQVSNAATNGVISLVQGAGSREDVNHSIGTIGTSIWEATFTLTVTGGNTNVYFASFLEGTSNFAGRVWVTSSAGSDFTFALSNGSSIESTFSTGLTFGTSYTLKLGLNGVTGMSYLTLGASTINSTTAVANPGNYTSFAFRQSTGNSTETISSLSVAAVPEPTSVAMLIGGAGMMFWNFRRKRLS